MKYVWGLLVLTAAAFFVWWQEHPRFAARPSGARAFLSTGTDFLQPAVPEAAAAPGEYLLNYDTAKPRQTIAGFGGALSDSSLIHLRAMPPALRRRLLRELFAPGEGLNLSLLRVPVGATDFGKETYSYEDRPGRFDFSRLKNVFAMIKEIRAINPSLRIMLSPWSAPAWMKNPESMHGGNLRAERTGDFAAYLARAVREYENNGLPVAFVSVQNEPFHAIDVYPTMRLETETQIALIGELHRLLRAAGSKAAILGLDHNYIYRQAADQIWAALPGRVAGIAYHCYEGDPDLLRGAETPFLLTECTDIEGKSEDEYFGQWLQSYVLRPGLLGAEGAIAWNLVLDEAHGPTLGPCYDCRPLVRYDRAAGTYRFNGELKAIGQVSKFLRPGARRLETETPRDPALSYIAYQNPDGGVVVVAQNTGAVERVVDVPDLHGGFLRMEIPGKAAATILTGTVPGRLAADE
jgi:glucosylceramidase